MGSASKRERKSQATDSGSEDYEDMDDFELPVGEEEYFSDENDNSENGEEMEEDEEEEAEDDEDEEQLEEEDGGEEDRKDAEIEELEKEYMDLRHQEQDILKNLKQHKDEDFLKGQAVKNQRALWDKSLELRFLLQKAFSNSNRLPKEPIKSSFCELDKGVEVAYSDLITSSKNTLNSLWELQEALLENNKHIVQATDGGTAKLLESSRISNTQNENDEDWFRVAQMHQRIGAFRDKSIDKWHRKTQVTTGAAAIKGKLQAFNQNISEQVAAYMRDPSRMLNQMQLRRSTVHVFGMVLDDSKSKGQEAQAEGGDAELLDDSEFYQQLLKEFFETIDPNSSETAFYALKKLQTKKRKIVDRRASKSRKIRYTIHEKIVNFMTPMPVDLHQATPKLVNNIFGLKLHKSTTTTAV
ncbi:putative uncharacterized protein DDB_G0270496 [Benincasa hispida]|uniref:putative uncharacterized protein DDB_G0270496 n=1 Tax=Benincasa hispida TaxID=102211 RepID=UPI0018FFD793|nr:putative uncharacterized protein DDB_G0270496 [Benincasa hispida]XP_038898614.1 putative uncharacterized protein DDB_G0270496 [Benincasa hispida]XP_038898621.1 putative uncharacterized protein DDB_G0270496 [Benincasa hispida]